MTAKNMILDTIAYHSLRLTSWSLNRLSLPAAEKVGKAAGFLAWVFSSRKKVVYADLKAALGDRFSEKERRQIIWNHYQHLGLMFVEVLRLPSLNKEYVDRFITVHHFKRYEQSIQEGRGGIYLTAHFGNWELLQVISGVLGYPFHILARNQKMNRLNEFLNQLRESHGSFAIQRGMGVRGLLRSLRRGELVGVLGDQDAGKYEGEILPFFGRKTTLPAGSFELAARTGAPIYPCLIVRKKGFQHEIHLLEKIEIPKGKQGEEVALEPYMLQYLKILEDFIARRPDQWLWENKRWKYSWTKRILILTDGKKGHEKQSQAVAERFKKIHSQYGRPGMEYLISKLKVDFRSPVHKVIFQFFSFFFIPFAQARIRFLRLLFSPETFRQILDASADFVISAGSSLVPLNLCLAKDSRAKSIVLMKPAFPFQLFRYDLAIVPAHDEGVIPAGALRMLLSPSTVSASELKEAGSQVAKELRDLGRIRFSLFIGGSTHRFQMPLEAIQNFFSQFEKTAARFGDCLITSSRRTPKEITDYLKQQVASKLYCQLFIDPNENPRPEIVAGMMDLAEILIVTEDSVSMISEAVAAGKKVLVLKFPGQELPSKHKRFQELLALKSLVTLVSIEAGVEEIESLLKMKTPLTFPLQQELLDKRLQEIL